MLNKLPLIITLVGTIVSLIWFDSSVWYIQITIVTLSVYLLTYFKVKQVILIVSRFIEMVLLVLTVFREFLFGEGLSDLVIGLHQGLFVLYGVASVISIMIFIRFFNQKEQAN